MTPPDREAAADAAERLFTFADELLRELPDDQGRTLSLAVAMFVGTFLTTLKNMDDREAFCEAAISFALQADLAIDGLDLRGPGR